MIHKIEYQQVFNILICYSFALAMNKAKAIEIVFYETDQPYFFKKL